MRCSIIPPYLLDQLAQSDDQHLARLARETLARDVDLRRRARSARADGTRKLPAGPRASMDAPVRRICDAHHTEKLPGTVVREEGAPATGDVAVTEAYDGLGATWALLKEAFDRASLDGKGLPLIGTVHYGTDYDNAFWDGSQMVFGDGDGRVFGRFTASVDVIGHELGHGVTEHTAGLLYQGQSGALNESMSDVIGSMVRQHLAGQSAQDADWLIGAELLLPGVKGRALRDMLNPGTAYDDPELGQDPQPAHMRDYVETVDDNGGVHLNSGIPNRAFALAARAVGGTSWEGAGKAWYAALTGSGISADCDFVTFAGLTVSAAEELWGTGASQVEAIRSAWEQVGVLTQASATGSGDQATSAATGAPGAEDALETDAPTGEFPAVDAKLLLRRTGGIAGRTQEVQTRLADLPDEDTSSWQRLLGSRTLQQLALDANPEYRDVFFYRVACEAVGVDVAVPDPDLPDAVRELMDRTLREG